MGNKRNLNTSKVFKIFKIREIKKISLQLTRDVCCVRREIIRTPQYAPLTPLACLDRGLCRVYCDPNRFFDPLYMEKCICIIYIFFF